MTAPTLLAHPHPAAAGDDQVARLRDAACAAQRAGDAQAVADLTWQIQQLNPTPQTQGDDVTMIQDCPRCGTHGLRPDTPPDANCRVCLGDGAIVTGHGRLAYELARQAIADHEAGHDRLTRFIDHSGHGHSCNRCRPNRPDLVAETAP